MIDYINNKFKRSLPEDSKYLKMELLQKLLPFNLDSSYINKIYKSPSENNLEINVNYLDTTNIRNLKGVRRHSLVGHNWTTENNFWDYGFKNVCLRKNKMTSNYAFDEHNAEDDYFLMLYSEILRFGKFNLNTHKNNKIFLEKFLQEKNIDKNHEIYYKYF
jgi:hypothetical protein